MAVAVEGARNRCGAAVRLVMLDQSAERDAAYEGEGAALREVARTNPHVVLVGAGPVGHPSRRLVESIKKAIPKARVVVTNVESNQQDVLEFITAGASGFILSDATVDEFFKTVRLVAEGLDVVPPALAGVLLDHVAHHTTGHIAAPMTDSVRMTKREREVVSLIADGLSNKEIAQRLHIATNTVKGHVHNILEKLALHTRLQVSVFARAGRPFGPGSS